MAVSILWLSITFTQITHQGHFFVTEAFHSTPLVGWALVVPPGTFWAGPVGALLGPCGPGPCGLPLRPCGPGPCGPALALMGLALMGLHRIYVYILPNQRLL